MTIDEAIAEERDNAKTQREIAEECFEEHIFDEKERIEHLKYAEEYEQLAEWLEELKKYREIGTVEECRVAAEKKKAKKPVEMKPTDKLLNGYFVCPICGGLVGMDEYSNKHRGGCGQKLDWRDEE